MVAILSENDLKLSLVNQAGKKVFGPPQHALTQRSVNVRADACGCTVNIKQVDAFSLETHKFVVLQCPTDLLPKEGELVGYMQEKFALYHVLHDASVLIVILRNLDLGGIARSGLLA